MRRSQIKSVIFDCDGTLVDSEPITNNVLVQYVSEFGLTLESSEALALFVGRDMREIVEVLEKRLEKNLPDEFETEFRARQATALEEELRAIDGAERLLETMNVPISLASNAPRDKIGINLRVTGLNRFFPDQRVFSAYDIKVWKPEPDLFLHVADQTGFAPENCAVVEDSVAGVEAAISAGMHVFCYSPHGKLDFRNGADVSEVQFVERLDQLEPWLVSSSSC